MFFSLRVLFSFSRLLRSVPGVTCLGVSRISTDVHGCSVAIGYRLAVSFSEYGLFTWRAFNVPSLVPLLSHPDGRTSVWLVPFAFRVWVFFSFPFTRCFVVLAPASYGFVAFLGVAPFGNSGSSVFRSGLYRRRVIVDFPGPLLCAR